MSNGFTNEGTIALTKLSSTHRTMRLEVSSGILVNTGTIDSPPGVGTRVIDGDARNDNLIRVRGNLTVISAATSGVVAVSEMPEITRLIL